MRKSIALLVLVAATSAAGCAGIRQTDAGYTAHAECLRIFSFPIPYDDQAKAYELANTVGGGRIVSAHSTAADWTSIWGFFGNLFGFHCTSVSGTK